MLVAFLHFACQATVTDYHNEIKGKHKTVLHESDTKTENSQRIIPISPELKKSIDLFFISQDEKAKKSNTILIDDPFIIANNTGGFVDPSTYRKWFSEQVDNAGLSSDITPHKLRHSFASTALRYGMDLKNISSLLGHYSTDFTARTYVHTNIEGQYDALMKMINNKNGEVHKC